VGLGMVRGARSFSDLSMSLLLRIDQLVPLVPRAFDDPSEMPGGTSSDLSLSASARTSEGNMSNGSNHINRCQRDRCKNLGSRRVGGRTQCVMSSLSRNLSNNGQNVMTLTTNWRLLTRWRVNGGALVVSGWMLT
ncbi:MAG: hypothetical protein ACKPKO_57510, partial [Candidatus Fonsibacter sp.]